MSEMIYEEQKQEALPELPVYAKIYKELMEQMEPYLYRRDSDFWVKLPEQSLADAYQKVMENLEQSIHTAEEEEKAAHGTRTNTESDPSCVVITPLYLNEDTWQEVEDVKAQVDRFRPLGVDDSLQREFFMNLKMYQEFEKKLQGFDEFFNDMTFMRKYHEHHEKLGVQIRHINQALQIGEQNIVPQLQEIGASFRVGILELEREHLRISYERVTKRLQVTYGIELSDHFLRNRPKDALQIIAPAERIFLAEKETLLAQHETWNPVYTVRTAKKLAEQGVAEKEIVEALQKHAPDIQNLPSAALRQNAAARIAKSAAGSVRVGQQEQNKEKSR